MFSASRGFPRALAACFLAAAFVISIPVFAQDHVVSSADLQKEAAASTTTRQQNAEALQKSFSNPKVENAMKAAGMDATQVKTAVSSLSDAELAKLAARVGNAQQDFAGGRISDRDLLLILVAIAALILIIVAVH